MRNIREEDRWWYDYQERLDEEREEKARKKAEADYAWEEAKDKKISWNEYLKIH